MRPGGLTRIIVNGAGNQLIGPLLAVASIRSWRIDIAQHGAAHGKFSTTHPILFSWPELIARAIEEVAVVVEVRHEGDIVLNRRPQYPNSIAIPTIRLRNLQVRMVEELAAALALSRAERNRSMSKLIMEMTTRSSIKVKLLHQACVEVGCVITRLLLWRT